MSLNPGHYFGRGGFAQEYPEGYIKVTPNGDQVIAGVSCGPTGTYTYAYFTTERLALSPHLWSEVVGAYYGGLTTKLEYGSTSVAEFEVRIGDLFVLRVQDSTRFQDVYAQNFIEDGFLLDVDRTGADLPAGGYDSPGFIGDVSGQINMYWTQGVMSRATTDDGSFQRRSSAIHYRRNGMMLYNAPGTLPADILLYLVNLATGAVTPFDTFNALERHLIYFFAGTMRKLSDDDSKFVAAPVSATVDAPLVPFPMVGFIVPQAAAGFPVVPLTYAQMDLGFAAIMRSLWGGAGGDEYIPTYTVPMLTAFLQFDAGGLLIDSDASGFTPQSVALRANDPNSSTFLPPLP